MSPIDASSEILKVTGLDTNTGELSFESSTFIVIFTSESILSAALTAITYEKDMQIITVYYKIKQKSLNEGPYCQIILYYAAVKVKLI